MEDVKRDTVISQDTVYDVTSQDIDPYLKHAHELRAEAPEIGKYKKEVFGCVYACTIPSGLVEQLMRGQCCGPNGYKYNVLSDDQDEYRKALVHVQNYHKELLTVKGKPFAEKRPTWQ